MIARPEQASDYRDPVSQDSRSLTRHGQDRKAELLQHRRAALRRARLRGYPDDRHRPRRRRGQGPRLLVLREQGDPVRRDRRRHRPAAAAGESRAIAGIDDPLERLYVGTAESVRFVPATTGCTASSPARCGGDRRLRETWSRTQRVQVGDAAALLAEGEARGVIRDDDVPPARAGQLRGRLPVRAAPRRGWGSDGPGGVRDRAGVHAAARYVVRAVGADASAVEAVLARPRRRTAPDPVSPPGWVIGRYPAGLLGTGVAKSVARRIPGVPASDGPRRAHRARRHPRRGKETMASSFSPASGSRGRRGPGREVQAARGDEGPRAEHRRPGDRMATARSTWRPASSAAG